MSDDLLKGPELVNAEQREKLRTPESQLLTTMPCWSPNENEQVESFLGFFFFPSPIKEIVVKYT